MIILKRILPTFLSVLLSLFLCFTAAGENITQAEESTLAATKADETQENEKNEYIKPDSVISYFDCSTEYKAEDNVYCVMVVTDDCSGAATDDRLYITLTGQNGVSTLPINVNNPVGCDALEYRTYYGCNKQLGMWEPHADSCRDGSFNLYIIRSPEDLTSKISEITLMTTPDTWFAEGSWSLHSVYVYKLVGKAKAAEYSGYMGIEQNPCFDFSKSQYALFNGYTLDAASCADGWDKVSVSLSKLPTDARFIEETFCDLGYTGFPTTGAMRKTSYTITVFMLICVGVTIVFSLCVLLYRRVIKKRGATGFISIWHRKTDTAPKKKYFR